MKTKNSELKSVLDSRLLWWRGWIVLTVMLLGAGLFFFQIRHSDRYVQLALDNRLRLIRIPRLRGQIYDRNGVPLAVNVQAFDVMAYPLDLKDDEVRQRLVSVMKRQGIPMTRESLDKRISSRVGVPFRAISLISNLSMSQMTGLMNDPEFPRGLFPIPIWRRAYPAGPLAAHVVGYVGEISENELVSLSGDAGAYVGGDMIGKNGIERSYEELLRGMSGEMMIEVDARGRPRSELDSRQPAPGEDVKLTLDLNAQKYAADLMGEHRGAVVALDVTNGEVLVLYSSPTYDPNPLVWGVTQVEWSRIQNDPDRPMLNRALSGQYSPGSIFKILTGYAALESGQVTEKTSFRCTGAYKLGAQTYRCWQRWGHGMEDIRHALRDSCDVYFYETSQLVGIDRYLAVGRRLGLDKALGIDVPSEASGNLAGPEWKKKTGRGSWLKGDTVNYSIGQGFLLMTPLQMAHLFASMANGGQVFTPHLRLDWKEKPRDAKLNPKYVKVIMDGIKSVTDRGGTGYRAGQFDVSVAGKTGTVQNPHGKDHGVFVGLAPADKPRYAVMFFIEAGESGGRVAAPLAGQLLAWLIQHNEGTTSHEGKR